MTITSTRPTAQATWPAPGLAWQLRQAARTTGTALAAQLRAAADVVDGATARVDDVEDLDALVLSTDYPVEHVTLLDRLGDVHVAHPDRTHEQVVIVRHPSLREARTTPDDWPLPLAHPSHQLDQCRFPMTVIAAPTPFLIPASTTDPFLE